MSTKFEMPKR